MKRIAQTVRAKVKALTNPDPKFVSLVIAGANQTPFKSVKADVRVSKKEWADMLNTLKADGHDIARLFFPADKFTDEAAVKAWLDDGGYDYADASFDVEDHGITVKSNVDFAEDSSRDIEIEGGVTVSVALRADAAAEKASIDEGENRPAPAAEDAGSSVEPVASEKSEGDDAEEHFIEPVSEDARKALYQISELVEVIYAVKWLTQDFEFDGDSPALAAVKAAGSNLMDAMAAAVAMEADQLTEVFKREEADASDAEDEPTEIAPVEAEDVADAEKADADETITSDEDVSVTDEVSDEDASEKSEDAAQPSLADVMGALTTLTASVEKVTAVAEEAREIAEAAAKRVDDTEAEEAAADAVTRRSADVEGPDTGSTETKAKSAEDVQRAQRASRDLMGL